MLHFTIHAPSRPSLMLELTRPGPRPRGTAIAIALWFTISTSRPASSTCVVHMAHKMSKFSPLWSLTFGGHMKSNASFAIWRLLPLSLPTPPFAPAVELPCKFCPHCICFYLDYTELGTSCEPSSAPRVPPPLAHKQSLP